jgi:tetratricopeptide (TPR) repeat protein
MKKKNRVPAPKSEPAQRLWLGHFAACVVLLLLVCVVYSNSFQSGWVLDNKIVIQANPANKQATWENLKLLWTKDYWWPRSDTGGYRPIVSTTYLINWAVLGNGNHDKEADQVVGFHWVNLFAHAINAMLAYGLTLRLLRRPWLAFFAAALFAVHPIATESVTNIIGRADEFAAMSFFGATWLYIRSTESTGVRRVGWLIATAAVYGFGCFSKESAPVFLAIPVVYDAVYRWGSESYAGQRLRKILGDCAVAAALTLPLWLLLYVRSLVFRNTPVPARIIVDNPMLRYVWSDANSLWVNIQHWLVVRLTAVNVATKALWKLIWPAQLSSDYSFNQIPLFSWQLSEIENLKAIASALFVALSLIAVVWCYKRHKIVSFMILFYWVGWSPASSFTRIAPSIFGERFLYLPSLAFFVLVVLGIDNLLRRIGSLPQFAAPAVFAVMLIPCGIRTYYRNFDWRSDITLAQSAIKASPNAFRSYQNLAFALYEIDPTTSVDRIIELAEKGTGILDPLPPAENTSRMYLHMGMYYGIKGEMNAPRNPDGSVVMNESTRSWFEKAARVLERGAEIDQAANSDYRVRQLARGRTNIQDVGISAIYMYLGITYSGLGKNEQAVEAFKYARHLDPRDTMAYSQLASVQGGMGHLDEMAITLLQAVSLDPSRGDVWQSLNDLYTQINKEPIPAIEMKDGRLQLREDNKLVQRHLVAAYREFVQIAKLAEQPALVEEARSQAVNAHHIDPKLVDDALKMNVAKPKPPNPLFHARML